MKKKLSYQTEEKDLFVDVVHGLTREFAPNLIIFIVLVVVAQLLFFTVGPDILIPNLTDQGLMLLNFVFAILIPYILSMIVKAICLLAKKEGREEHAGEYQY